MNASIFGIIRRAVLLPLLSASVMVTGVVSAQTAQTSPASFTTVKETIEFAIPYDEFTKRLEATLGKYDPKDAVLAATDLKKSLERIHASEGQYGIMLFRSDDHGALWALIGEKPRKAIRYYMGNPLYAIQMTRKNLGASLYAPLTMVVYEIDKDRTGVFYDRPSSLFGQFKDADIDKVGVDLDNKLRAALTTSAMQTQIGEIKTATFPVAKDYVEISASFDAFAQRFEKILGRYNPQDTVLAATDQKTGVDRLKASQGEQGFMLFARNNHGGLWALIGEKPRKAYRYFVGNPLYAIQMTKKNLGAALYAPLTLVVYEKDNGKLGVIYDRPSSLFGQFNDHDINKIGVALDTKLRALLEIASKSE